MTCSKAHDTVMLYQENPSKKSPFKSLALYRHVNKCSCCREFYLAMDQACEQVEFTVAAPPGLTESVMSKIREAEPVAMRRTRDVKPKNDWMRRASCLYWLFLAACMGVLYNTEIIRIPDPTFGMWDRADILFNGLAQTWQRVDVLFGDLALAWQQSAFHMANMIVNFSNYILAMTAVLGLALVVLVQRERKYGRSYNTGR